MSTRSSGEAMSSERTQATVAAFLAALGEGGGEPARFLAEGATFTAMETGEVTRGREAVAALLALLWQQAFAATPIVRTLVVTPERVMAEAQFVGLHVGEFAGVLPTGRAVSVPYAAAFDVADDTITAIRAYLPLDALLRQIREGHASLDEQREGIRPAEGPRGPPGVLHRRPR